MSEPPTATEDALNQTSELVHQISGPAGAPVLVYLPGLHGDWTPLWRARPHLNRAARLLEVAYPRAPEWTLADHAAALGRLLDRLGIAAAHLLGESFGSLVAWEFGLDRPDRVRSLALVGGFCQPPPLSGMACQALGWCPPGWMDKGAELYWAYAGQAGAQPPDDGWPPFAATRTPRGWAAVGNRLRIIRQTDMRPRLGEIRFPVAYLGGERDRIVPVQREIETLQALLNHTCRFRSALLRGAPHPVLPACPRDAGDWVNRWLDESSRPQRRGDCCVTS